MRVNRLPDSSAPPEHQGRQVGMSLGLHMPRLVQVHGAPQKHSRYSSRLSYLEPAERARG